MAAIGDVDEANSAIGVAIAAIGAELSEETLGRQLFELAAAARVKGLDPEGALRLQTTQVMNSVERKVADVGPKGVL